MRKYIFQIFVLFLNYVSAQETVLLGKISDKKTKEILPGAVVSEGVLQAVVSDVDGNYLLHLAKPETQVSFALIGYKTQLRKINAKPGDTIRLDISLEVADQVLDEVVVSAGKFEQKLSEVTVSMEVIKPTLLLQKASPQLDAIIGQIPSVYITDGQVSIRGGSGYSYGAGSRVIMLVDEMPLISADAADIKWNYVPIENMEQIEVIKGASSALFGSSALNGVINMRTAYAKSEPVTSIQMYQGVYGTPARESLHWWKGKSAPIYKGMNMSHAQKIKNLDVVLAGHLYDDDGFRKDANEVRIRGNVNLRYNFEKIRGLSVGINTTCMETKGNLFFLWKNDSLGYISRDSSLQNYANTRANIDPFLVYNHERFGKHSFRTRYFLTNNNNDKNQASRAELYYGEYQFQKKFTTGLTLTTGFVGMKQVVLSPALYSNHFGRNYAYYLQVDQRLWDKLTLSAGIRAEHFRIDTAVTKGDWFFMSKGKRTTLPFQPVARFGVNYQPLKYTFIRTSFGQGYRFPSIAEKFIATSVGSLNIIPNENLQPERGWSAELGVKQGLKIGDFKGFVDVAGFISEYQNMMEFSFIYRAKELFPLSNIVDSSGFQSQNLERGRVSGIDASVNGTGKIGNINVTILCGYTYMNPINPKFDSKLDTTGSLPNSNLLKYRMRHLFKNDINLEYKGYSIGWSTRYASIMENIDKRFELPIIYEYLNPNFPSIYNNPAFYILPGLKAYRQKNNKGVWINDVRIAREFGKHFRISFIINNVLNTEFMSRPGFIEAPRTFVVQVNAKF